MTMFPVILTTYLKVSTENALFTKLKVYPKQDPDDSVQFTDTCYQEVLVLAHKETLHYNENEQLKDKTDHVTLNRSGDMRILCIFKKKLGYHHGVLIRNEAAREFALNVSFIEVHGKQVIPCLKDFITTEGSYQYYKFAPFDLHIYVDYYEMTSCKGVIEKYNSLDPSNQISNTNILSYFQLSRPNQEGSEGESMEGDLPPIENRRQRTLTTTTSNKTAGTKRKRTHNICPKSKKSYTTQVTRRNQTEITDSFKSTEKRAKSDLISIQSEDPLISLEDISEEDVDPIWNDAIENYEEDSHLIDSGEQTKQKITDKTSNNGSVDEGPCIEDIYQGQREEVVGMNNNTSPSSGFDHDDSNGGNWLMEETDQEGVVGNGEGMVVEKDQVNRRSSSTSSKDLCIDVDPLAINTSHETVCDDAVNDDTITDGSAWSSCDSGSCDSVSSLPSEVKAAKNNKNGNVVIKKQQVAKKSTRSTAGIGPHSNVQSRNKKCNTTTEQNQRKLNFQKGENLNGSLEALFADNTLYDNTPSLSDASSVFTFPGDSTVRPQVAKKSTKQRPGNRLSLATSTKTKKTVAETVHSKEPGQSKLRFKQRLLDTIHPPCVSPVSQEWIVRGRPKPSLATKRKKNMVQKTSCKNNKRLSTKHPPTSHLIGCVDNSSPSSVIELSSDEDDNQSINNNQVSDSGSEENHRNLLDKHVQFIKDSRQTDKHRNSADNSPVNSTSPPIELLNDESCDNVISPEIPDQGKSQEQFEYDEQLDSSRQLCPEDQAKVKEILSPYKLMKNIPAKMIKKWLTMRRNNLIGIYRGKIPSGRHSIYYKGSNRDRSALSNHLSCQLLSNQQYDILTDSLNTIFCSKNVELFSYMNAVLIPEAIILLLMDFHDLNYCDAEEKMMEYNPEETTECVPSSPE